ncbi:MAG: hypothetical protein JST51_20600 [Armatimonadetes bacterium]|nr:hypothetical protein [Armatimonadota bacterium]
MIGWTATKLVGVIALLSLVALGWVAWMGHREHRVHILYSEDGPPKIARSIGHPDVQLDARSMKLLYEKP